VAIAVLIRHARSSANAQHILAGRAPGIELDEVGREQALDLARRLAEINLVAVVSSPAERCLATSEPILASRPDLSVIPDDRLAECDYGDWTGQALKTLAKTRLWKIVQAQPSGVEFPGGETMRAMQHRAVEAIRSHDASADAAHGTDAVWAAISHGDVIKSIVADALGVHLDQFQRIVVDAASVTVIRYTPMRPFVLRLNDVGSLAGLRPPRRRRTRSRDSDAVVGGPTG
jgi:probable phosphomutase (TIGR03848 family)